MRTLKIAALIIAMSIPVMAKKGEQSLTRTVYISLGFKTCEHIENAYLFAVNKNGDEVSVFDLESTERVVPYGILPLRRDFIFTYYPNLDDTIPKVYIFKVKGSAEGVALTKYIALGMGKVLIYHPKDNYHLSYRGEFGSFLFEKTNAGTMLDYSDRLNRLDYAKYKKRDIRIKLFTINVACPRCTTTSQTKSKSP
jgi:hypothetical protein